MRKRALGIVIILHGIQQPDIPGLCQIINICGAVTLAYPGVFLREVVNQSTVLLAYLCHVEHGYLLFFCSVTSCSSSSNFRCCSSTRIGPKTALQAYKVVLASLG